MKIHLVIVHLLLVCITGCASLYINREPLPIAEVVNLSKAQSDEDVIQRFSASRTTYALRGSDFGKLKALGVHDPVLDFMQQSLVAEMDLLTRYWVLGDSLGGCANCYPQPVNIDTLQSGYASVPSGAPGRYQAGKPPGTPDWVPATPGHIQGSLSIQEIENLAHSGIPDEQILDRIRSSRITTASGVGGTTGVKTQPVAGVGGAQLAGLRTAGVSDAIADAVQGQFLAEFIEAERLRYQNWGKGPGPNM
jgi:hypothetical protein